MSLRTDSSPRRLRSLPYLLVGVVCIVVATLLGYDVLHQRGMIADISPYTYTINQSVNNTVKYAKSSFYPTGPTTDTTAYITDLTDTIDSTFNYSFQASEDTQLTYTYGATATVRGTYGVPDSKEDNSNVWARSFQLKAPTEKTVEGKKITLNERLTIPFREYRKVVEDFRLALSLPIRSELEVTLHVTVKGTANGEPFADERTTTISTPLNVQIYQLATKLDKNETKNIQSAPHSGSSWRIQLETIGAVMTALFGIAAIVAALYPASRYTPYQRELRKIYRYHDGIIIRTKRAFELPVNKTVVPVETFDDILNIEEETKSPIIASTLGTTATRFLIANGDAIYSYTLGEPTVERTEEDELLSIESLLEKRRPQSVGLKKTTKKVTKRRTLR